MHEATHLSSPNRGLTREAASITTTPERTFAQVWAHSGAPALVGYEAALLATLARTDSAIYEQLTAVDLDDPDAVRGAVEVIENWRRNTAAGTRHISFGPRPLRRAGDPAVDLTQLPAAA